MTGFVEASYANADNASDDPVRSDWPGGEVARE